MEQRTSLKNIMTDH